MSVETQRRLIRVGFIGCGGIVQTVHGPNLAQLPDVKLAACTGVHRVKVEGFLEKYGLNFYTDYKEMLAKEALDAVVIATPNTLHASMAIDALESDAHVLVEKPMTISLEDAIKMVEVARRRQRILMVGHHMRFERNVQIGRELVVNGKLGKVYHIRALHLRRRGVPSTITFLQRRYSGGGPMWDIGVHTIDAVMFMTNFPKPKLAIGRVFSAFPDKVYMRMDYPVPMTSSFAYTSPMDVEDFAVGFINFEDSLTMYIETTWASYVNEDKHEIAIIGTEGGIHFKEGSSISYMHTINGEFVESTPFTKESPEEQRRLAYVQEVKSFIDAITRGSTRAPYPACTGEQGLLTVAIIEAIYRSAESGKEESINVPHWVYESIGW